MAYVPPHLRNRQSRAAGAAAGGDVGAGARGPPQPPWDRPPSAGGGCYGSRGRSDWGGGGDRRDGGRDRYDGPPQYGGGPEQRRSGAEWEQQRPAVRPGSALLTQTTRSTQDARVWDPQPFPPAHACSGLPGAVLFDSCLSGLSAHPRTQFAPSQPVSEAPKAGAADGSYHSGVRPVQPACVVCRVRRAGADCCRSGRLVCVAWQRSCGAFQRHVAALRVAQHFMQCLSVLAASLRSG